MSAAQRWPFSTMLLTLGLALVACGDRVVGETPDGGVGQTDGPLKADAFVPPTNSPCTVGIRVDECCNGAIAVTQAEIDSDECLVAWPIRNWNVPQVCLDRQPKWCSQVDCAMRPPPSRLTERDATGQCVFVDECQTDADCVWASDQRQCCSCGEAVPKLLFDRDPCFGPRPPGSPETCTDACTEEPACGPCMAPGSAICERLDPNGEKTCNTRY